MDVYVMVEEEDLCMIRLPLLIRTNHEGQVVFENPEKQWTSNSKEIKIHILFLFFSAVASYAPMLPLPFKDSEKLMERITKICWVLS